MGKSCHFLCGKTRHRQGTNSDEGASLRRSPTETCCGVMSIDSCARMYDQRQSESSLGASSGVVLSAPLTRSSDSPIMSGGGRDGMVTGSLLCVTHSPAGIVPGPCPVHW